MIIFPKGCAWASPRCHRSSVPSYKSPSLSLSLSLPLRDLALTHISTSWISLSLGFRFSLYHFLERGKYYEAQYRCLSDSDPLTCANSSWITSIRYLRSDPTVIGAEPQDFVRKIHYNSNVFIENQYNSALYCIISIEFLNVPFFFFLQFDDPSS